MRAFFEWLARAFAPAKNTPVLEITPDPITMSLAGQRVLKYFESCRLKAYWDATGKCWTIGWGNVGPDVHEGLVITQAQADQLLRMRLSREFVPGVLAAITRHMEQCEFDAMADLAYNIGVPAFQGSTLVRKFNAGDIKGAADEFPRWNKSGGQVLLGLRRRRAADRALFMGASADEAIKIGSALT